MKGPGLRLEQDVRRVWECPVCLRRIMTGAEVVNLLCPCQEKTHPKQQLWMRIVEQVRPRRVPVIQPAEEPPCDGS